MLKYEVCFIIVFVAMLFYAMLYCMYVVIIKKKYIMYNSELTGQRLDTSDKHHSQCSKNNNMNIKCPVYNVSMNIKYCSKAGYV